MGLDSRVEVAFGKSQLACGSKLPKGGIAFLSVRNDDKPALVDVAALEAQASGERQYRPIQEWLKD